MELSTIISIAAILISAGMLILTFKRDGKANTSSDISKEIRIAESFKELNVKLDYQSKQLDQLAESNRNKDKEVQQMSHKLIDLESKLKTAFEKIDENRNRIKELEQERGKL